MGAKITFVVIVMLFSCTASENRFEKNLVATRKLFDAFNQHEWQSMASYYSDSASFLDPSFGKEFILQSRSDVVTKYTELQNMFPDIHDEVVGMYPSGDKVVVEFISTGTMADSIKLKLPIVTVLTFRNGLVVKDATYYDLENP